jgi:hypothetical protein
VFNLAKRIPFMLENIVGCRCWPKPRNGCNICRLSLSGSVPSRNLLREDGNLVAYDTQNSIMLQALSMGNDAIIPKHGDCVDGDCASIDMTIASSLEPTVNLGICDWRYCGTKPMASNTQTVEMRRKRWGNRLCMEIHCRALEHDIASYVNCGIKHCA